MAIQRSQYGSLALLYPEATLGQLLDELKPPREFQEATFASYVPHVEYPSQATVRDQANSFARGSSTRKIFSKQSPSQTGLYLDGGFGVGKTHLLAAVWHEFNGSRAFGSFIAYTSLIGALGFAKAVSALSKFELICIDEFELDDPGDTMMMSRLLNELSQKGVKFAATSNTPPNALGEGRFAASDFAREIHGISDRFLILRIEGEDHRHRPINAEQASISQEQLEQWLTNQPRESTAVDDFGTILNHISKIHPSRYGRLFMKIDALAILDSFVIDNQVDALRFVALVDRAYEAQIKICATGTPITAVFAPEYLSGGYRKKYLRAISRLGAMSSQ